MSTWGSPIIALSQADRYEEGSLSRFPSGRDSQTVNETLPGSPADAPAQRGTFVSRLAHSAV